MNIQEIINDATSRMMEPSIANVTSTTNEEAIKYLSSANKVAKSISELYDWANLLLDYEFDTVIGSSEYPLPDDYKRMNSTYMYNIDNNLVIKTETPDRALAMQANKTVNWTNARFRIIRDNIKFTVSADQVNVMKFNYVSNDFAKNTETTTEYKDRFNNVNDTFLLDDELLTIGIIIDIKAQYGFDNTLELSEFKTRYENLIKNDKGNYVLSDSDEYKTPFSYPSDWNIIGE